MVSEWGVCELLNYCLLAPSPPFHSLFCDAGAPIHHTSAGPAAPCWILPARLQEGDWKVEEQRAGASVVLSSNKSN